MSDNLSRFTKTRKKYSAYVTTKVPDFMTGIIGLLLISALFGGIYGIAFGAVSGQKSDDIKENTIALEGIDEADRAIEATVGDIIKTGQFEITITSVEEEKKVGTKYINSEADAEGTFIAVTWQYKSVGNTPSDSISNPAIILAKLDGTEIDSDISASGSYASEFDIKRVRFRELIPEELVKEAHVFAVPKKIYAKGGWRLQIKADRDVFINVN